MGNADKLPLGTQTASSKRDWNLYVGGGLGGGGGKTVAGVTRYTFWVDHSKFDTYLRKLITQNVSFEVWTDGTFATSAPVYIDVGMSNDKPDALIRGTNGQAVNGSILVNHETTPPPYFINTTFLSQPTDPNYQTDQGRFNYNQYVSNGLGTGNNNKIVQSFVPSSPFLTGVKFRDLFHVSPHTDPATYDNLVFEIWDTNKATIASFTLSKHRTPSIQQINNNFSTQTWVTASDSKDYWIEFQDITIPFNVKVVPGQIHYFVVKQEVASAAHHYGIGSNTVSGGAWDGNSNYYYINGQAFTAAHGGTTLTAVGTNISTCFLTLRNNGRTGITFLWDSAGYYWFNPDNFLDQFRFVKIDSDKRI